MLKEIIYEGTPTGLLADESGNIFDSDGHLAHTFLNGSGYFMITIKPNLWTRKQCYVHRLIAELFVKNDDPQNKHDVHHLNGNKKDNRACNLEWISKSFHGLATYLEDQTSAKKITSLGTVNEIASELDKCELPPKEIAKKYKVDIRVVHKIKNGEAYDSITGASKGRFDEYNRIYHRKDLIDEKNFIIAGFAQGKSRDEIINGLMERYAHDRNKSNYIYEYVMRGKNKTNTAINNVLTDLNDSFSTDGRFKYMEYIKHVEDMLLKGKERQKIVKWVEDQAGISWKKADDLVKQRLRALLNGNSIIPTKDRLEQLRVLREAHDAVVNRRKIVSLLNNQIDSMLIEHKPDEEILTLISHSKLFDTDMAIKHQLASRKFALKKRGDL
jgi:hypothetical protein